MGRNLDTEGAWMTDTRPLDLRVLSVARGLAGAYAALLLADLGARCSRLCWCPPRPGDLPGGDGVRAYFDAGVEIVDQPMGQEELLARLPVLAARFDLVITDFSAGEVAGEHSLYPLLRPFNPRVVVANADHFGRVGPYAAWAADELTDYAMGGYWALAGDPAREPLRVPGHQAGFHAGMHLAVAALAATRYARLTGQGQEVEVAAVDAMVGAHWSTTVAWTHEGRVLKRTGSDLFEARDGWVFFYRMGLYANVFILIDRPELIDDPRWNTIAGWLAHAEEIWGLVREWCRTRTVDEIVIPAQELRMPVTSMATAERLLSDPQLSERGYFRREGAHVFPGPPYRWEEPLPRAEPGTGLAEALAAGAPAPVAAPTPITSDQRGGGGLPLAGLRVVEVTNNWAGPIAGRHLADLGAEVIKVELSTKPATRASHYPGKEPGLYHWNRSGYFNEMNRNKRDVALNLATARGQELFKDLARWAEVIVENNSARVMPQFGLGYDHLAAVNPRLVMASISGFGATGPCRDWVAFGSNIEAASGLAAVTGYEGTIPYRTGSFVADPIAGAHAVVGVLAALERRDRTGKGAHLDIALTESALPFMIESLAYYGEHGENMPRRGNAEPDAAPTGAYRCAGTDEWVAIAVRTDEAWRSLCAATGMAAEEFPTGAARVTARAAIDERLSAWTRAREQYACVRLLQAAGVAAAPILHNWQLHGDPHLYARGVFIPIEHPDTGVLPYPGFPWRFSATPPVVRMAAPRFAEGNGYVFGSLLRLDEREIAALYDAGVTAHDPVGLTAVVLP